jgi:hypothetical protein
MASVRISRFALVALAVVSAAFLLMPQHPRASMVETVTLAPGATISLATPSFIVKGKRYAFSWPGGGPPQTFVVKDVRTDGWILVEVAEENVDPAFVPLGSVPTRWLNAGIATSIQEMRPLLY